MSDQHVVTVIDKAEHIAWMRLNRPEKKNCLSNAMMDKMIADIRTITEDRDIKVLVLSAAGDSFCSGLDLNDLREANKQEHRFGARSPLARLPSCFGKCRRSPSLPCKVGVWVEASHC